MKGKEDLERAKEREDYESDATGKKGRNPERKRDGDTERDGDR